MYFIPRNNRLYNYVAHTSVRNRYLCTGFFVIGLLCLSFYFFQRLINAYSDMLSQELSLLQKQHHDGMRIETKNKKLIQDTDLAKEEVQKYKVTESVQEYFKKHLFFVLDVVKNSGLKLNSYGVQKEKNHEWYTTERAHFDVTGSLKQIMEFFEVLKNSQKMIAVDQWSLVRTDDDTFHMQCDVEFVCIV